MHTKILSERQLHRALPTLMEIEALHVAQCECPEKCDMLRRLREDITELKAHLDKCRSRRHKCRKLSRYHKQRGRRDQ
jgi:hypothetical protein